MTDGEQPTPSGIVEYFHGGKNGKFVLVHAATGKVIGEYAGSGGAPLVIREGSVQIPSEAQEKYSALEAERAQKLTEQYARQEPMESAASPEDQARQQAILQRSQMQIPYAFEFTVTAPRGETTPSERWEGTSTTYYRPAPEAIQLPKTEALAPSQTLAYSFIGTAEKGKFDVSEITQYWTPKPPVETTTEETKTGFEEFGVGATSALLTAKLPALPESPSKRILEDIGKATLFLPLFVAETPIQVMKDISSRVFPKKEFIPPEVKTQEELLKETYAQHLVGTRTDIGAKMPEPPSVKVEIPTTRKDIGTAQLTQEEWKKRAEEQYKRVSFPEVPAEVREDIAKVAVLSALPPPFGKKELSEISMKYLGKVPYVKEVMAGTTFLALGLVSGVTAPVRAVTAKTPEEFEKAVAETGAMAVMLKLPAIAKIPAGKERITREIIGLKGERLISDKGVISVVEPIIKTTREAKPSELIFAEKARVDITHMARGVSEEHAFKVFSKGKGTLEMPEDVLVSELAVETTQLHLRGEAPQAPVSITFPETPVPPELPPWKTLPSYRELFGAQKIEITPSGYRFEYAPSEFVVLGAETPLKGTLISEEVVAKFPRKEIQKGAPEVIMEKPELLKKTPLSETFKTTYEEIKSAIPKKIPEEKIEPAGKGEVQIQQPKETIKPAQTTTFAPQWLYKRLKVEPYEEVTTYYWLKPPISGIPSIQTPREIKEIAPRQITQEKQKQLQKEIMKLPSEIMEKLQFKQPSKPPSTIQITEKETRITIPEEIITPIEIRTSQLLITPEKQITATTEISKGKEVTEPVKIPVPPPSTPFSFSLPKHPPRPSGAPSGTIKTRLPTRAVRKRTIPIADIWSKTITELKTGRPATQVKITPKTQRAYEKAVRKGSIAFIRFPTAEIASGKVKINARGMPKRKNR